MTGISSEGRLGRALVVTASDRAARGEYADRAGPVLVAGLRDLGFEVAQAVVVPDGQPVADQISAAVAAGIEVVLTTGGTGVGPRDLIPEVTEPLIERALPGVAEAIRAYGASKGVATAVLSRGLAGVAGNTVIINLPGSTGGCRDGLAVLAGVLAHLVAQVGGADHGD